MKKFLSLLLALAMGCSLAACGSTQDGSDAQTGSTKLKILDTEYTNENYAICIAKENTGLLDEVNAALIQLLDLCFQITNVQGNQRRRKLHIPYLLVVVCSLSCGVYAFIIRLFLEIATYFCVYFAHSVFYTKRHPRFCGYCSFKMWLLHTCVILLGMS